MSDEKITPAAAKAAVLAKHPKAFESQWSDAAFMRGGEDGGCWFITNGLGRSLCSESNFDTKAEAWVDAASRLAPAAPVDDRAGWTDEQWVRDAWPDCSVWGYGSWRDGSQVFKVLSTKYESPQSVILGVGDSAEAAYKIAALGGCVAHNKAVWRAKNAPAEQPSMRTGYLRHSGPWKCGSCPAQVPYDPDWSVMSAQILAHGESAHPVTVSLPDSGEVAAPLKHSPWVTIKEELAASAPVEGVLPPRPRVFDYKEMAESDRKRYCHAFEVEAYADALESALRDCNAQIAAAYSQLGAENLGIHLHDYIAAIQQKLEDAQKELAKRNDAGKLMIQLLNWLIAHIKSEDSIRVGETPVACAIRLLAAQPAAGADARELLIRARPYLMCDSDCGCDGEVLLAEIDNLLASKPATPAPAQEKGESL